MQISFYLAAGAAACFIACAAVGQPAIRHVHAQRKPAVSYRAIEPILHSVCTQCHKGARAADGLDLTSFEKTMKGDRKGKVVFSGSVAKSRLATVLHGKPQLMPPGGPLSKSQIESIEAWIRAGAKK